MAVVSSGLEWKIGESSKKQLEYLRIGATRISFSKPVAAASALLPDGREASVEYTQIKRKQSAWSITVSPSAEVRRSVHLDVILTDAHYQLYSLQLSDGKNPDEFYDGRNAIALEYAPCLIRQVHEAFAHNFLI